MDHNWVKNSLQHLPDLDQFIAYLRPLLIDDIKFENVIQIVKRFNQENDHPIESLEVIDSNFHRMTKGSTITTEIDGIKKSRWKFFQYYLYGRLHHYDADKAPVVDNLMAESNHEVQLIFEVQEVAITAANCCLELNDYVGEIIGKTEFTSETF